jgi:tRNA nucleotidyltransferase (CCA-adding enzyme)
MLLHDLGKPECYTNTNGEGHFYDHAKASERIAKKVLKRLKLSNEMISTVTTLVRYHDAYGQIGKKGMKRLVGKIGMKNARRLLDVTYADMCGQASDKRMLKSGKIASAALMLDEIERDNECVTVSSLAINGNDLLAAGLQGREIGKALNSALEGVIEGDIENSKNELMDYIMKGMS